MSSRNTAGDPYKGCRATGTSRLARADANGGTTHEEAGPDKAHRPGRTAAWKASSSRTSWLQPAEEIIDVMDLLVRPHKAAGRGRRYARTKEVAGILRTGYAPRRMRHEMEKLEAKSAGYRYSQLRLHGCPAKTEGMRWQTYI